tara:strand:+ start:10003 stop:10356 length:354 start_codon:yes stop_codon:yes gene_type:complete
LPKTISLNTLYAGKHWTYRKKVKDAYKKIVEAALADYDHYRAKSCTIYIRYNTRADVDNNVLVSKFVADTLVANGWIADDSPKYYNKLTIAFDPSVEKNYCEVRVTLVDCMLSESED